MSKDYFPAWILYLNRIIIRDKVNMAPMAPCQANNLWLPKFALTGIIITLNTFIESNEFTVNNIIIL